MSDDRAQHELIERFCLEVNSLEGDAVEIGVHQGASAALICKHLPNATVYLFDTFEGMPAEMVTPGVDEHKAKDFNDTSLKTTRERLKNATNAVLVPGVFPQSATVQPKIKFAHVDVDLYLSTKAALEWCWPLLVDGGVLLNDDYGCGSCRGAKKAVDEFVATHNASCEVIWNRAILRRHL